VGDVRAYILINTEVGKAAHVVKKVQDIDGVDLAADLAGPYDVIVRAGSTTIDELGRVIVTRIQQIEGVTRTLSCPEMSTM
jgi:DNA-binding Lrp family transcriptional regulator